MNRINNYQRLPMIPATPKEPIIRREMQRDVSSSLSTQDAVFLENRKVIKHNTIYEKGIFVDVYV